MTAGTSEADAAVTSTLETPRFELIEAGVDHTREEFEQDVREGLRLSPKKLSCRFFYDAEGSRLFEAICQLPEYYPFRAEREILERRAADIVKRCDLPTDLVELGSGSAEKTTHLIDALLEAQGSLQYVPIDISPTALEDSARGLLADRPSLRVVGVAGEYNVGLEHLPDSEAERRLFLWLGSNIGNLRRADARAFVRRLRQRMDDRDRMLLGVDLRKDESIVQPAYDDSQGVTASFNKNLLARINRELGGDFDLDAFTHDAIAPAQHACADRPHRRPRHGDRARRGREHPHRELHQVLAGGDRRAGSLHRSRAHRDLERLERLLQRGPAASRVSR